MKTLSLISGKFLTLSVNGIEKEFNSKKELNKEIRNLEKQGFSFSGGYAQTDEFDGLCQASQLGFKTFECTILG
jgi:hypothetical protein